MREHVFMDGMSVKVLACHPCTWLSSADAAPCNLLSGAVVRGCRVDGVISLMFIFKIVNVGIRVYKNQYFYPPIS